MVSKNKLLTLSLIIPAYNEEFHIKSCLDLVAKQTHMPDEVIVIDNNCADNTVKIAKTYPFVNVIKEKKQGIVYARNAGFNKAKGEIICRIDADTFLPNDWVEDILEYYSKKENKNTAVTGRAYFANVAFPPPKFWIFMTNIFVFRLNRFIAGHYILWGSNMALPRKLWQAVRGDTCLANNIHEDLDLAIHLHRRDVDIVYDPKLIVGVEMKRVFNKWTAVYENLMWWPRTFRVHHSKRWVIGLIGAYFLLFMSLILVIINKPIFYLRKLSKKSS